MPPERGCVGEPSDWLTHARSDLELARAGRRPGVLLEVLCFHAQQAVEKALEAVLIRRGIRFPYTHNLQTLIDLLPAAVQPSEEVRRAAMLTDFAVATRYPTALEPVEEQEYEHALSLAAASIEWAESWILGR